MSDIKSKIKSYLKDKKILLVSEVSTDRAAWKRVFLEYGAGVNNFYNALTLDEAEEFLEEQQVDILFTSDLVEEQTTMELVSLHIEKVPDRSSGCCFMSTEKNSLAVAAHAAENDIDGLLIKPYNQQDLLDLIEYALEEKVTMNKETKLFHSILADIRSEEIELAEAKIKQYIEKRPTSPFPFYLSGLVCEERNNPDEAIESYYKALEQDPENHKVLCRMFDLFVDNKDFEQAYPCAEILCENYPINPDRIPNLIRASLATKNYQSLIDFCEMILALDDDLTGIHRPVAAALALSAKRMTIDSEKRDLVVKASAKALELVDASSSIYVAALENLLEVKNYRAVSSVLEKIPSDDMNDDLLAIELRFIYEQGSADKAFIKAQTLVKLNKANEKTYEILLRSGKEIGKDKQKLEDIVFDAAKEFPDLKDQFLAIIN